LNLNLVVEGAGVNGGNTSEPSSFNVTVRDAHGNAVALRGDALKVQITGPGNRNIPANLKNNNDGTWTVTYQAQDSGQHDVVLALTAQTRVGINVGTDASKTKVFGPGVQPEGVQDNLPTYFNIEAIGTDGRPMGKGGDPFEVKVTGPRGPVPVKLTDNGNGTYTADFAPDDAGKHRIDVTLKNKPVANSPYTIDVQEGADHNTSFLETFQFVIRARTKRNQNMSRGGEKFEVQINGPQGPVQNQLQDNQNGTYTCTYSVPHSVKGSYTFSIRVNGHDILGSPWTHQL